MSKGFASNYRIVLLAGGMFLAFGAIGLRLVELHVLDREQLVRHVDRARDSFVVEQARRGDILDARGDVLATSRSLIVLGVDPQSLRPEDEGKWPELARLIGMPAGELARAFRTKTRPSQESAASASASGPSALPTIDVANVVDEPAASGERLVRWAKLSESVEESTYAGILKLGIKGVYGTRSYRRTYPRNGLAAHVVGFVNKEN